VGASLARASSGERGRAFALECRRENQLAGWALRKPRYASTKGRWTVATVARRNASRFPAEGTLSGRARGVPFRQNSPNTSAVLASGGAGFSVALIDASTADRGRPQPAGDGSDSGTFDTCAARRDQARKARQTR